MPMQNYMLQYQSENQKVKTGTPCLLMEEIVYDQYDKPFHRTKSVLRGDKFKYISPRMNIVKHVNSN